MHRKKPNETFHSQESAEFKIQFFSDSKNSDSNEQLNSIERLFHRNYHSIQTTVCPLNISNISDRSQNHCYEKAENLFNYFFYSKAM